MNPEEAVEALDVLRARAMVPMHWGAFQLTDEPLVEPAERRAAVARDEAGGVQARHPVPRALQHQQADERLSAGEEHAPAFDGVLVIQGGSCEVSASVLLEGNFKTGRILLRTRNVERFGILEHQLVPEAITQESLEEFAGFILGETNRIGPLLLKGA